jgi:FkbM family methyltransferase
MHASTRRQRTVFLVDPFDCDHSLAAWVRTDHDFTWRLAQWRGRAWLLATPANDHIGTRISVTGAPYELDLLEATFDLLSPDDVVVDVGANVGNHTLAWGLVVGARVVSVEANPTALAYLRRNITANDLDSQVTVYPVAAGATEGHASITETQHGNLGATIITSDPRGPLTQRRLDDLLGDAVLSVKLLKIDVEDNEPLVLAGAQRLLSTAHPYILAEARTPGHVAAVETQLRPFRYVRDETPLAATPTFLWRPV